MEVLKFLLKRLTEAEKITDELERKLEKDPENEELDRQYDEAYKVEYEAYITLAENIEIKTDGKINLDTAKKLISTKREEIKDILERVA